MEKQETARPKVAVLIRDLIFETKIRATATSVNVDVWMTHGLEELSGVLRDQKPQLLIVDLNTCEREAMAAIQSAKSAGLRVLGFVSHVDLELASRAREAGADEAMPRSRFAAQLPSILSNSNLH